MRNSCAPCEEYSYPRTLNQSGERRLSFIVVCFIKIKIRNETLRKSLHSLNLVKLLTDEVSGVLCAEGVDSWSLGQNKFEGKMMVELKTGFQQP